MFDCFRILIREEDNRKPRADWVELVKARFQNSTPSPSLYLKASNSTSNFYTNIGMLIRTKGGIYAPAGDN